MPRTIDRFRVRVAGDLRNTDYAESFFRREMPWFPTGAGLQLEFGAMDDGKILSLADYASLTMQVRPLMNGNPPLSSVPPLMAKTVEAADFGDVDDAGWADESAESALFLFDENETALTPGEYWLSVFAVRIGSAYPIPFVESPMVVRFAGSSPSATPPDPINVYLNSAQVKALLAASAAAYFSPTAVYDGNLQLNDEFGVLVPLGDRLLDSAQFELAEAAAGADVTLQVLDAANAVVAMFTIPAGVVRGKLTPNGPDAVTMAADAVYHFKLAQIGATTPGAQLRFTPYLTGLPVS